MNLAGGLAKYKRDCQIANTSALKRGGTWANLGVYVRAAVREPGRGIRAPAWPRHTLRGGYQGRSSRGPARPARGRRELRAHAGIPRTRREEGRRCHAAPRRIAGTAAREDRLRR